MTAPLVPRLAIQIPNDIQRDLPVASSLLSLRLADTGDLPLAEIRNAAAVLTCLRRNLAAALSKAAPRLRSELAGDGIDRLAHIMSRGLTQYMMQKNQYLPVPAGWDLAVKQAYRSFLEQFAAGAEDQGRAAAALRAHQRRVRKLLELREADGGRDDQPVCATYGPELQLDLLRLDPTRVPGPILDIGCGEDGNLVKHLHALGRADAWGLDALCETSGPLVRGNWDNAPLAPRTFGTIIAHQSFSLHFLQVHLNGSEGDAVRHARLYMRLLEALMPGGRFHYAPGIPFIEELLTPERWSVQRWAVDMPAGAAAAFRAVRITALPFKWE